MKTKAVLISAVLLLAVLLSACGPTTIAPAAQASVRSLNVSGTGEVTLKPDIAYINIGVHTEKATASEATAQNNTDSQAVINALTAAGIAADDIQTTNFNIYQRDVTDPTTGAKISSVYAVDNTVYVTVRKLDKLGDLLDAAVRAGANNVNSIQFDVADKTKALSDARLEAVKTAKAQAAELAAAAGVSLGQIQSIQYMDASPSPVFQGKGMGGGAASTDVAVPINPGQMQITVTVTIAYDIQ